MLIVESPNTRTTNQPRKGRSQVTWTIFIFEGTNNVSGTAEATAVKFCKQVGYVKP